VDDFISAPAPPKHTHTHLTTINPAPAGRHSAAPPPANAPEFGRNNLHTRIRHSAIPLACGGRRTVSDWTIAGGCAGFKNMMVKRNMELQLEAMKYGSAAPARTPLHLHGPDHVSSSDAQQWPTVLLRRVTTWLPAEPCRRCKSSKPPNV
jgi:hypothetical protein